jgi:DNA primase
VNIWTRNNFYEDFEIQDFISLIAFAKNTTNYNSMKYLCHILGLSHEDDHIEFKKSNAIKRIKKYKTIKKEYDLKILPESILNLYDKHPIQEWVDEGIDIPTQSEFEVHLDNKEKRWCFTLRDEEGNLIGRKGRTWVKDFEVLKIPKYLYYHSNGSISHLYNLHRAKRYIESENSVIIVESEKSVMKLWAMGFKNVVAIGNKKISPFIAKQLLSLRCSNFIFALDKDVLFDEVCNEAKKFKLFKNLWIIIDRNDLLDKKDSPCDEGFSTWLELYSNRERVSF